MILPVVRVVWIINAIIGFLLAWMRTSRAILYSPFPRLKRYSLEKCRLTVTSEAASNQHHQTLSSCGPYSSELEVKKSRFIGYACHISSWSDAQIQLDSIKKEHPKARHWCYAFCAGVNPVNERCSDDGEPAGTAGVPILNAIRSEELSDTFCVVVRYFGGIKLGAGGLVRAYGNAARQVLRESPRTILIPKSTIRVGVSLSYIGALYEVVSKYNGSCNDEQYDDEGNLFATIICDTSNEMELQAKILDATKGTATFVSL